MSAVNFSDNNNALYHVVIKNSLQRPLECPLTMDIPENPVVDPHGHTFEKQVILLTQKQIDGQDHVQCPYTDQFIPVDRLYPNNAVKQVAQKTKEFTKELKRLNQLAPKVLTQEEMIKHYEGKIIELTAIHDLDLQRLGELQLEIQQKGGQIQVLQKAIQERDIEIEQLRNQVVKLQNQYKELEGRFVKYEEEMKATKDSFGNELREVNAKLENKDLELKSTKKRSEEMEDDMASFKNELLKINNELSNNKQTIDWWKKFSGICVLSAIVITKALTTK